MGEYKSPIDCEEYGKWLEEEGAALNLTFIVDKKIQESGKTSSEVLYMAGITETGFRYFNSTRWIKCPVRTAARILYVLGYKLKITVEKID